MSTCLIIPAAGKGTRLGLSVPKVFCKLGRGEVTPFDVIEQATSNFVDKVNLVLSPIGVQYAQNNVKKLFNNNFYNISIQKRPIGMGDAVFCGNELWQSFNEILIIWGDQVSVSHETIKKCLEVHRFDNSEYKFTVPLVKKTNSYVDFIYDDNRLYGVHQKRENELIRAEGYSDLGVFILSVKELVSCWHHYINTELILGNETKEINFLPFLPYLSRKGWSFNPVTIDDVSQSIGLNNRSDFFYFNERF